MAGKSGRARDPGRDHTGKAEDNLLLKDEYGISNVLLQKRAEVLKAYRLDGTPTTVVVGRDGAIASESVEGTAVEALLRMTLRSETLNGLSPAAPALETPDRGESVLRGARPRLRSALRCRPGRHDRHTHRWEFWRTAEFSAYSRWALAAERSGNTRRGPHYCRTAGTFG